MLGGLRGLIRCASWGGGAAPPQVAVSVNFLYAGRFAGLVSLRGGRFRCQLFASRARAARDFILQQKSSPLFLGGAGVSAKLSLSDRDRLIFIYSIGISLR